MKVLGAFVRWLGWSALWFVVFLLAFYVSFDPNVVKGRLERSISKATDYDTEIGEVELAGLTGLRLVDIVLRPRDTDPSTKARPISLDYLELHPVSLLSPSEGAEMEAGLFGGTVSAEFLKKGKETRVSWDIEDIDIRQLPWLHGAVSLPMKGRLSSHGELDVPKGDVSRASGTITIGCKGCVLGDGKTRVNLGKHIATKRKASAKFAQEGVTLPPLSLGSFEGTISIDKGSCTLEGFDISGKDVEASLQGVLTLRRRLESSSITLYLKFRFSDEAKKKHPELEGIELSVQVKGKRSDGYYGISVTGTLGRLRVRPSKMEPPALMRKGRASRPRGNRRGAASRSRSRDRRRRRR